MVIAGRIVRGIARAERGRVSKGDHVGVSRVHEGHKRWRVFGHVDNGARANIAIGGSGIALEREQRAIAVRVPCRPAHSFREEVRE